MSQLPHLDADGAAHMVDVGGKDVTHRVATAEAFVRMQPDTLEALVEGNLKKGDAFAVARIAGITGAKKASDLVPLAHPLPLTHISVEVEPAEGGIQIRTRVETRGVTGVEIEALAAASTAALTIYDMAKGIERGMVIERVQLTSKSGGRSGDYRRGSA